MAEFTIRLKHYDYGWYGFIDGFEDEAQILRGVRRMVNYQPVWDLRYKIPFPPAPEYSVPIEHTLDDEDFYDRTYVLTVEI